MSEGNLALFIPWSLVKATSAYAYFNYDLKIEGVDVAGVILEAKGKVEFRGPSFGIWAPAESLQERENGTWIATDASSGARILVGDSHIFYLSDNAQVVIGGESTSDDGDSLFVNVIRGKLTLDTAESQKKAQRSTGSQPAPSKLLIRAGEDITVVDGAKPTVLDMQRELLQEATVTALKGQVVLTNLKTGIRESLGKPASNSPSLGSEFLEEKRREREQARREASLALLGEVAPQFRTEHRFLLLPQAQGTKSALTLDLGVTSESADTTDVKAWEGLKVAVAGQSLPEALRMTLSDRRPRLELRYELSEAETARIAEELWTQVPLRISLDEAQSGTALSKSDRASATDTVDSLSANIAFLNPEKMTEPLLLGFRSAALGSPSEYQNALVRADFDMKDATLLLLLVHRKEALPLVSSLARGSQGLAIGYPTNQRGARLPLASKNQIQFHLGDELVATLGWPEGSPSTQLARLAGDDLKSDFWYTGTRKSLRLTGKIEQDEWTRLFEKASQSQVFAYCNRSFKSLPMALLAGFENSPALLRASCPVILTGERPPSQFELREGLR